MAVKSASHAITSVCQKQVGRCYIRLILLSLTIVIAGSVEAASLCKAIAVIDVATTLNGTAYTVSAGSYLEPVTTYKVDKGTNDSWFCSHSLCYLTHLYRKGKKSEALRLINCRIGNVLSDGINDVTYYLDPIREKNSEDDLRRFDVINRLLDIGLCEVCADNAVNFYLKKPSSDCAKLVRQALEGNPTAIVKLTDSSQNFCQWEY
jgi:hypothetical protein